MDFKEILKQVVEHKASDVHFKAAHVPTIRLSNGSLYRPSNIDALKSEDVKAFIDEILGDKKDSFSIKHDLDIAYELPGLGRFRVNIYNDYLGYCMAFRVIPTVVPDINTLNLPDSVKTFATLNKGLVLVTGPTGNGKSTTLASLIDLINQNRACHIVTVEDPIEFLHTSKKAMITQREVGHHTSSFLDAIRSSLREDPDVVMIGEMRDYETISAALTLAETGHLVFSTLHTIDAPQTIDRIIDVFPEAQQVQVKTQLSSTLAGVVSQNLIASKDNSRRILACEVMMASSGIKNCIAEGKTKQIYSLMQIGQKEGMQTFQSALQLLENAGKIAQGFYRELRVEN